MQHGNTERRYPEKDKSAKVNQMARTGKVRRGTLGHFGTGQFLLRHFGNFNLKLWYYSILRTCGMLFFSILDGIKIILQRFPSISSFQSEKGKLVFVNY